MNLQQLMMLLRPWSLQGLLPHFHLCHMQGDLSLLSYGGSRGLPQGHVVAYQATHDLHVRFAKALRDSVNDADFTPVRPL